VPRDTEKRDATLGRKQKPTTKKNNPCRDNAIGENGLRGKKSRGIFPSDPPSPKTGRKGEKRRKFLSPCAYPGGEEWKGISGGTTRRRPEGITWPKSGRRPFNKRKESEPLSTSDTRRSVKKSTARRTLECYKEKKKKKKEDRAKNWWKRLSLK